MIVTDTVASVKLPSFTESSNFETVSIPAGHGTVKDSPVGFNIGGELTYTITPNVAGAFLLRFSRANADFSFEGAEVSMNVGNVQVGAGVRGGGRVIHGHADLRQCRAG